MTVINKDLSLLAILAASYIIKNTEDLSDESVETLKDISFRLSGNPMLGKDIANNKLVDLISEAFYNLKEITEAYNDLEYEGE